MSAFTSRYSDYDGYWLFGFLVTRGERFTFDLTGDIQTEIGDPIVSAAFYRVRSLFYQQLEKAKIPMGLISSASVFLEKNQVAKLGPVNHQAVLGQDVIISARGVSDLGTVYTSTKIIFVARHDPEIELRSVRR
ncbi:MAG: hypothetical protein QM760_00300 [Nibricoccus sp.]